MAAAMALSGFLAFAKPRGVVSRAIVDQLQRALPRHALGHCGTLDPIAEGVLVIAVGSSAGLSRWLPLSKSYDAVVKLGVSTDTDDASGEVLAQQGVAQRPSDAAVDAALQSLAGVGILQTPPAYSAVWLGNCRAYTIAAKNGVGAVNLAPRRVTCHSIERLRWGDVPAAAPLPVYLGPPSMSRAELAKKQARRWPRPVAAKPLTGPGETAAAASEAATEGARDAPPQPPPQASPPPPPLASLPLDAFPELHLRIACDAGYYVRALARDLGSVLGVPATLAALVRTESGGCSLDVAAFFDPAARATRAGVLRALLPPDWPFQHLPAAVLAVPPPEAVALCSGGVHARLASEAFAALAALRAPAPPPPLLLSQGGRGAYSLLVRLGLESRWLEGLGPAPPELTNDLEPALEEGEEGARLSRALAPLPRPCSLQDGGWPVLEGLWGRDSRCELVAVLVEAGTAAGADPAADSGDPADVVPAPAGVPASRLVRVYAHVKPEGGGGSGRPVFLGLGQVTRPLLPAPTPELLRGWGSSGSTGSRRGRVMRPPQLSCSGLGEHTAFTVGGLCGVTRLESVLPPTCTLPRART